MKNSLILKKIRLQNFATFTNEEISFDENFNVIIGETGSGKSLIFDALNLIFGSRSDKNFVRADSERAIIEATFIVKDKSILDYLESTGYPSEQDEVLIKRMIQENGKSKSYLNYQQCKVQTLQNFAQKFIDLIGQFENQKLLQPNYQLYIIDSYAQNDELLKKYQAQFVELQKLQKEKEDLVLKKEQFDQRSDYVNFQLEQINELSPSIEDEQSLIKSKEQFLNFDQNSKTLSQCQNILSEGDHSIHSQFNILKKLITEHGQLFSNVDHSEINALDSMITDLSYKVSSINLTNSFEDESLEDVLEKLDQYQKLKRKFGGSIESLLKSKDEFESEKNKIQNFESHISQIDESISDLNKKIDLIANKLHKQRLKASKTVEKLITQCLHELNMPGSNFYVNLDKRKELNSFGHTNLEFHIETNEGEGVYPLSQIASGGELSRVLLAIRRHITSKEFISIFLFDEIDTGIGGETALLIGKLLKNISSNSQVIAISHLPQIAFQASQLIEVEKRAVKDNGKKRTISESILHTQSKAIEEKARLMTPIN